MPSIAAGRGLRLAFSRPRTAGEPGSRPDLSTSAAVSRSPKAGSCRIKKDLQARSISWCWRLLVGLVPVGYRRKPGRCPGSAEGSHAWRRLADRSRDEARSAREQPDRSERRLDPGFQALDSPWFSGSRSALWPCRTAGSCRTTGPARWEGSHLRRSSWGIAAWSLLEITAWVRGCSRPWHSEPSRSRSGSGSRDLSRRAAWRRGSRRLGSTGHLRPRPA